MIRRRTLLVVAAAALLACSPRFDWREVRGDGFVGLLPGRAQAVTRELQVAGQAATMTMWSAGVGSSLFAIGAARLPAAAFADAGARVATIAYFREGLVRNIGGSATQRRSAPPTLPTAGAGRLLAAEAVEAVGTGGPDGRKSRLAARFFIVDDQLFQVVALGADGEIPPEALDTFFASFRVTPS